MRTDFDPLLPMDDYQECDRIATKAQAFTSALVFIALIALLWVTR